ncbi:MAG: hypothetical protein HWN65_14530 [Candidatus Helarchaeota archaeon]|nr:hypothetical protein [Candidatus Helarchaeota archaeon]
MSQKEEIVEKLNDIIIEFESASNIVNYAIIFDKRIVLSPNVADLTKTDVEDILNKLDVEKKEQGFKKGVVNLIHLEFEDARVYYVRCTPKVRIVATPKKAAMNQTNKMLLTFSEHIKTVLENLSKPTTNEGDKEINQTLETLDSIVREFKIPQFEGFKKLVKVSTELLNKNK